MEEQTQQQKNGTAPAVCLICQDPEGMSDPVSPPCRALHAMGEHMGAAAVLP